MNQDGSITVRCKVAFARAPRGRAVPVPVEEPKADSKSPATLRPVIDPPAVPMLTRMLVLGHHLERLVSEGIVTDYSQAAKRFGSSKDRVTQLVNLTLLAPNIQDHILRLGATDGSDRHLCERNLRNVTALADWNQQRAAFNQPRS